MDASLPLRVFISYRRQDTGGHAGRLHDALSARLPTAEVFIDVGGIEPGTDFATAIADAIGRCDVMLALIGPRWTGDEFSSERRRVDTPDDYVVAEIGAALERDVRVIPLLIDGAPMPQPAQLPERVRGLARRNAMTIDTVSWYTDLEALLAVLGRMSSFAAPTEGPVGHPDLPPASASRPPSHRSGSVSARPPWAPWAGTATAVAGLLIGGLVLWSTTRGSSSGRTSPTTSPTGSVKTPPTSPTGLPDCYRSTVLQGVPTSRQIVVEEGTPLFDFIPGGPMSDPIALVLTSGGRHIGAFRLRYYPAQVKKVEVALDGSCRTVEGLKKVETGALTDSFGLYDEICLPLGGTTYRMRVNTDDPNGRFILELEEQACG